MKQRDRQLSRACRKWPDGHRIREKTRSLQLHDTGKTVLQDLFCVGTVSGPAKSAHIQCQYDGHGHAGAVQPERHERSQPVQPGAVHASDAGGGRRRGRCCAGRPILGKKQAGADPPYHWRRPAFWRRDGGFDVFDRAAGAAAAAGPFVQRAAGHRGGRPLFPDHQLLLHRVYHDPHFGGVPTLRGYCQAGIHHFLFHAVHQYFSQLSADLRQFRISGAGRPRRGHCHAGLPVRGAADRPLLFEIP